MIIYYIEMDFVLDIILEKLVYGFFLNGIEGGA